MLNNRIVLVFVQLVMLVGMAAAPAYAGPAASSIAGSLIPGPVCSGVGSSRPLGVDGGLSALMSGEITIQPAATASSGPAGVDGGLLSLLFARSEGTGYVAYTGGSCTAAFFPSGG